LNNNTTDPKHLLMDKLYFLTNTISGKIFKAKPNFHEILR